MFRLNHFQKAMLVWQRHFPYNAVHAIRLRGPADVLTLRDSITEISRAVGIGELKIDRLRCRYEYLQRFEPHFSDRPATDNPDQSLADIVNEAMNQPFPRGPHYPIRWYVFNDKSTDSHYIVLVYDHVIADAAAIEALLSCVLKKYTDASNGDSIYTLSVTPPASVQRAKRPFRRFGFFKSYRRTLALSWRVFWSRRPPAEAPGDNRTSVISRTAPVGLLTQVRANCRRESTRGPNFNVGLNDVFLAAFASSLVQQRPIGQSSRFWKPRIVLGSVLSQRPGQANDLSDFFGVCLHDVILFVDNPEDGVDTLARRIAVQTSGYKADAVAADAVSDMRLFLAKLSWPFLRNTRQSFRRFFPVWGGVSTVYVQQPRFAATGELIERYIRACPPGPVMPMVLAPTIWGEQLELSLVYRNSCIDAQGAESLLDSILSSISEFAGVPKTQIEPYTPAKPTVFATP